MFRLPLVCAIAFLTASTVSAAPRITFERTVPAHRNLGAAEDLVITYAIGDNDAIATFIDVFIDQTSRSGTLRVIDPTTVERSTERSKRWRRPPKYVEQRYRADAYLRIDAFSCHTTDKSGQVAAYDVDGNRVHRTQRWSDAVCEAHIDVLEKESKKHLAQFSARGEGTSPRGEVIGDEDRNLAVDQAARYAAVAAAGEITPRRIRETIALVENAPAFEEGMAYIDAGGADQARAVWENALNANQSSAPLHFNLATVYEATGNLKAAEEHYSAAQRLAPKDARYRYEHDLFRRRNGLRKTR
ncbi:MAG: tetratricopeptide repeat protein [Thermoanaerobaculia bacterium]